MNKIILGIAVFAALLLIPVSSYAASENNPGQPFDELMVQLEDINGQLVDVKQELDEIKEDLGDVKDTQLEAFTFTLDADDGSLHGARQLMIYGECETTPQDECSLFEIRKMIAPDQSRLRTIFLSMCVDKFSCQLLDRKDSFFTIGVSGGASWGGELTVNYDQSISPPLWTVLPTNILSVSGIGDVKAKNLIVISVSPGYKGNFVFVGEKPFDMKLTGARWGPQILALSNLECFDIEGLPADCTPIIDKRRDPLCFALPNFNPKLNGQPVKELVRDVVTRNTDLQIPLRDPIDCEICTDGEWKCDTMFFDKGGTITVPGRLGNLCELNAGDTRFNCSPLNLIKKDTKPGNIQDALFSRLAGNQEILCKSSIACNIAKFLDNLWTG